MFQVQQVRDSKVICLVGSPYATRKEAEQACSDSYRADWEKFGQITPTTHYVIAEQLPRWRVVLDFGVQYQTVHVRSHNSVGAMNAAEALAPGRCLAVLNQISLAADQQGPIDAVA